MKNNLGFNYVAKYNLLVKKEFLNIKLWIGERKLHDFKKI